MKIDTTSERSGLVLADGQALEQFEGSSRGVVPTCATHGPRGDACVAAIDAMVPCTGRVGLERKRSDREHVARSIDTSLGGSHTGDVEAGGVEFWLARGHRLQAEGAPMRKLRAKFATAIGKALFERNAPRVYYCLMKLRKLVESRGH